MTALDVCLLLYSPASLPHVRKLLTRLSGGDFVENNYLYRFALQEPGRGNRLRVYTLGSRGRDFLKEELEYPVGWYFRPDKVRHMSFGQVVHNLVLTRFLVAARRWASGRPEWSLSQTRTCYEIGSAVPGVEMTREGKERIKVIPDGWLLFERTRSGKSVKFLILLEIDRGSAYRHKFKEHIGTRLAFIKKGGEYSRVFGVETVSVAYVTTGETEGYRESRRRAMCAWTMKVLKELRIETWAQVFRFAGVSLEKMYEGAVFEEPVWYRPDEEKPVRLFEG